jgi:hypothetical protein
MATYTTHRTIIMILLAGALLAPSLREADAAALPAPIFASETDAAAYAWTQNLFSAAGFEFPTITIEFHRDEEGCGGARGRTHLNDTGIATIHVCATHTNPMVEDVWRRTTLLHEVAHAWIDQNADEQQTARLMELRGTETWLSRDQIWQDRGAEHAAEIFMWGVQDGDYKPDFRLSNTECDELSTGYELLTGVSLKCDVAAA